MKRGPVASKSRSKRSRQRHGPSGRGPQMGAGGPRGQWRLCVLLAVITAVVYGQTLGHEFVNLDDPLHVVENPHLNPPSAEGFATLWREPYQHLYIPLSYTLFGLEAIVSKSLATDGDTLDPSLFHAVNVGLHIAGVLLVFLILRQLVEMPGAAACGAMLFSLHPLQVESVAWISEQRGLFAAVLSLVAVDQYLRFANRQVTTGEDGSPRHRWLHYALGISVLAMALLSKPSAASVPLILAVIDLGLLRRSWRQAIVGLLPWLALAAIFLLITRGQQTDEGLEFVTPMWARPLVAGDALAFYLAKLVCPIGLAIHYNHAPKVMIESNWLHVAWLVPLAVAAGLFLLRRNGPWWVAGALFVAGVAPVLGLSPFVFQNYSTVADRYTYLAMLGPAWALAWWLSCRWTPGSVALSALFLMLCGVLSWMQTGVWHNSETLYDHALKINPKSHLAEHNLGKYWTQLGRHDQALRHFSRALELRPDSRLFRYSVAHALAETGRADEAIRQYRILLENDAGDVDARVALGIELFFQGKPDDALSELRRAVHNRPEHADAHYQLGSVLASQGKFAEAIEHFRQAAALDPRHPQARQSLQKAIEAAQ